MRKINLDKLKDYTPKLTPIVGGLIHEVLLVALVQNGHQSGVVLRVEGKYKEKIQLVWTENPSLLALHHWKNPTEVANFAAVGLSILLMQELTSFNSFDLALFGTGIDYWMSKEKYDADFYSTTFRKDARLEISGIFKERKSNTIDIRVKVKTKQSEKSKASGLPAWIVVAEFSQPKSKIKVIK